MIVTKIRIIYFSVKFVKTLSDYVQVFRNKNLSESLEKVLVKGEFYQISGERNNFGEGRIGFD